MKLGLHRNPLAPVFSRLKNKRHQRVKLTRKHLQSSDEVCLSDRKPVVEDERRNAAEEETENRITFTFKSRNETSGALAEKQPSQPCRPNDDEDNVQSNENFVMKNRANSMNSRARRGITKAESGEEAISPKAKELMNYRRSPIKSRASFQSENVLKSKSEEDEVSLKVLEQTKSQTNPSRLRAYGLSEASPKTIICSQPRTGVQSNDKQERDMPLEGDVEVSRRNEQNDNMTMYPRKTDMVDGRKHSKSSKIMRAGRVTELVKYMSHREGFEKGFEVLLEDFNEFVAYCMVSREAEVNRGMVGKVTIKECATVSKKSEHCKCKEASESICKQNNLQNEDTADEEMSEKSATSTKSKCTHHIVSASVTETIDDAKSVVSVQSIKSIKTEGSVSAVPITHVPSRATPAVSSMKSETPCVCEHCGHRLHDRDSKFAIRQNCSVDGSVSVRRKDDNEAKDRCEVSTSIHTRSEIKSDATQETIQLQKSSSISRSIHRKRPIDQKALQPLVVSLDDYPCPVTASTSAVSTKSSEIETAIHKTPRFGILSSLSTRSSRSNKKKIENNSREMDNRENAKKVQDNGDEHRDDVDVNYGMTISNEDDESGEPATSTPEKMTAIKKLPIADRPPRHRGSKESVSRYVTYNVKRVDSYTSLRSAPPRLSSDYPCGDEKQERRKTPKPLVSPSSINQTKANCWERNNMVPDSVLVETVESEAETTE